MIRFKQYSQLTAGSAVEAIMNTGAAAGTDLQDFLVDRGRVVIVQSIHVIHETVAGFCRVRLRRDATNPPPAAGATVLDVSDNIYWIGTFEAGQNGPIVLPGGIACNDQNGVGTRYYLSVEQPDGAAFVSVVLNGQIE